MENAVQITEKIFLKVYQDNEGHRLIGDDDGQLATIVYKGGSHYTLGDKPNRYDSECDNHEDAMYAYFKGEYGYSPSDVEKNVIWLPVYAYVHSGTTISTDCSIASCRWDSGRSGFVYTTKDKIRKARGCKRVSPQIKTLEEAFLRCHVKTFDHILKGEVYWYELLDEEENDIDSCGGFIGDLQTCGIVDCITSHVDLTEDQIKEKLSELEVIY